MKTEPIGCPYCGSLIDERTRWTCWDLRRKTP